jgi:hypothetical protein
VRIRRANSGDIAPVVAVVNEAFAIEKFLRERARMPRTWRR